jgi:hypothetical protein
MTNASTASDEDKSHHYRGFHMNAPTGETPVPLFSEMALITVFR